MSESGSTLDADVAIVSTSLLVALKLGGCSCSNALLDSVAPIIEP